MKAAFLATLLLAVLAAALAWQQWTDMRLASRLTDAWMRQQTLGRALVAYQVDTGDYPPTLPGALSLLTTPVAYLDALPRDPFQTDAPRFYRYENVTENEPRGEAWVQFILHGVGPDGEWSQPLGSIVYEPSNGLRSSGDLVQPGPADWPFPARFWKARDVKGDTR